MTQYVRASYLVVLLIVAAYHVAADAQVKRWAVVGGSPCCGAPAHFPRYLDANEACKKELPLGPHPLPCWVNHTETMVAEIVPAHAGAAACVHLATCLCGDCLIGSPDNPDNTKWIGTGANAIADELPCPEGEVMHLGRCMAESAKGKGVCPDCDNVRGNPANVGSGNKYQGETIYRSATLELVLYYNSQVGG
ncbi:MAG TPA: hypothetical protein VF110_11635, partial [Burkholderiales bacterium]